MEEDFGDEGSATPILPSMYRWISTTRVPGAEEGTEPKMILSFSVPVSAIPTPTTPELKVGMDVDHSSKPSPVPQMRTTQRCDVAGCEAQRKYRLVKDFQRGACGLLHLKHLEAQLVSVSNS